MRKVMSMINALFLVSIASLMYKGQIKEKRLKLSKQQIERLRPYYNILNHWLLLKQQHKSVEGYFTDNSIHTIAIYGIAELGKRLYIDIAEMPSVEVVYVIDLGIGEAIKAVFPDIKVLSMNDDLPKVDAIIVTPVFAFEEIKRDLSQRTNTHVVSIEEVVFYTCESVL